MEKIPETIKYEIYKEYQRNANKKHYEKHKDAKLQLAKDNRQKHKDYYHDYFQGYYETNKEKTKQKALDRYYLKKWQAFEFYEIAQNFNQFCHKNI